MPTHPNRRTVLAIGLTATATIAGRVTGADALVPQKPTRSDSLGPFFVSGMPELENINRFQKPGTPLTVSGLLRSAADDSPIAGATIEVWQTDGEGRYHPQANGRASDYDDKDLDMRGALRTDAGGAYRYLTVEPGEYFPRPKHFHYRIRAEGFAELVTQHYIHQGGRMPGGVHRGAAVIQDSAGNRFDAPTIWLSPLG